MERDGPSRGTFSDFVRKTVPITLDALLRAVVRGVLTAVWLRYAISIFYSSQKHSRDFFWGGGNVKDYTDLSFRINF